MAAINVEVVIQALFPRRVFAIFLVYGLFAGGVGYSAFAIIVEELFPRDRILSYGQQAGCIAMPSCMLMAGAVGYSTALTTIGRFALSTVFLLAVATCSAAFTLHLWNNSLNANGSDFSDVILYHPPLGFAGITFVAAICIATCGVVQKFKQLFRRSPSTS